LQVRGQILPTGSERNDAALASYYEGAPDRLSPP